ncbi:Uncharacterised protein [Vibrio cholerae]|nr:Uncharacterised protein [Vibrio cholerae]
MARLFARRNHRTKQFIKHVRIIAKTIREGVTFGHFGAHRHQHGANPRFFRLLGHRA